MRKNFPAIVLLAVVFALAGGGCKKSEAKKEEAKKEEGNKKAAKKVDKEPAMKEEAAPEAKKEEVPPEVAADRVPDVTGGPEPDVQAVPEEKALKPDGEAGKDKPEEKVVEAKPEVATPAGDPEEKPAESGDEPGAEPDVVEGGAAATDVVTDAAAEELPEGHFGRAFKLGAIMMVSDVIKYPDHYSTFETIKLRGTVLAASGNMVLLSHENDEGLFAICTKVPEDSGKEFVPGVTIQFEGKLAQEEWSMDAFGKMETDGKEPKSANGWILSVEGGMIE